MNRYQACLYLFQCISNGGSEYGHEIPKSWHFLNIGYIFDLSSALAYRVESINIVVPPLGSMRKSLPICTNLYRIKVTYQHDQVKIDNLTVPKSWLMSPWNCSVPKKAPKAIRWKYYSILHVVCFNYVWNMGAIVESHGFAVLYTDVSS